VESINRAGIFDPIKNGTKYLEIFGLRRNWEARNALQTPGRAARTAQVVSELDLLVATLAAISSSFGERRELGVEAKLCELVDEAFGPDFL
jgi:hypothetical protein